MRAVEIVGEGREARLRLGEAADPRPKAGEVLIDVFAAGINRGDTLQRQGLYPPPPGASPIIGLECAGRVAELGEGVSNFACGDRVMALLPGGGYAERAVAHAGSVLPVPPGLSLTEAGGIPEVFLTCHLTLFDLGRVWTGETVLVHGGGGGIGTAAIQLLSRAGARVLVTAGSAEKCASCLELGAERAVRYGDESFAEAALDWTEGRGVDAILDHVGGAYLEDNIRCLARGGRLILIGVMAGASGTLDLGRVLGRHLSVIGSTLRPRSVVEKAALVERFRKRFGEDLSERRLSTVVDRVFPLAEAQAAHERMEKSLHTGKIVLQVREERPG